MGKDILLCTAVSCIIAHHDYIERALGSQLAGEDP
jgi:hypothetical protein